MSTNDTARQRKLQMLATLSAAVAATLPAAAMAANPPNCSAWSASIAYTAGAGNASHSACALATETSRSLLVPPKRMVVRISSA